MDCREAEALAVERAFASTTAEDEALLEGHLSECPGCRTAAAAIVPLRAALAATAVDPPQGLATRTMDLIRARTSVEDREGSERLPRAAWRGLRPVDYAAGVIVAVGLVLLAGLVMLPWLTGLTATSRRVACANNERLIFAALQSYAADWDGHYPVAPTEAQALEILVKLDKAEEGWFLCPGSAAAARITDPGELDPFGDAQAGYAYDMTKRSSSPREVGVIGDRSPANHGGKGVNVTYNDGSAVWQEGDDLERFTAVGDGADRLYFRDPSVDSASDTFLRFRTPRAAAGAEKR